MALEQEHYVSWRRIGAFVGVILLCVLPGALLVLGMGLQTGVGEHRELLFAAIAGDAPEIWDYRLVQGTTVYTLLEWTVVLLTMATAMLAYAHFRERGDAISMLLCIVVLWMGAITAIYLLAFHGFIVPVENMRDFVQFTWTSSQTFIGVLLLIASGLVLWRGDKQQYLQGRHLLMVAVLSSAMAYALIVSSARSPDLPVLVRPDAVVNRPLELFPLLFFVVLALVVLPLLHRMCRSTFSMALWLSTIPLAAGQLYMALLSETLFDVGFTSAQITRAMAFAIIFGGLVFDYSRVCRNEEVLRRKLSKMDRRIRGLVDNAVDAIVVFDDQRRVRMWNRRATELFGWTSEEARCRDVVDVLFSDDAGGEDPRERFRRHLRDFARTGDAEELKRLREALVQRPNGQLMTVEYSIFPADASAPSAFAVLLRDVTEKKELQTRMFQIDRLAAVGTLAAGVVHEIKNPLTYMTTNVVLAREFADNLAAEGSASEGIRVLAGELEDALDAAERGGERIREIIEDMRVLSQGHPGEIVPVSVRRAVQVALRMTRGEMRHQLRIETRFEDVPCVDANETRLSQVFVNLIINAVQAMEEAPPDDHLLLIEVEPRGDEYVVARFKDTGPGISEAVASKIFAPFFTTKRAGDGTGLGLSLSRSIVEGLGGEIDVQSSPGVGSTFEVILPVSTSSQKSVQQ